MQKQAPACMKEGSFKGSSLLFTLFVVNDVVSASKATFFAFFFFHRRLLPLSIRDAFHGNFGKGCRRHLLLTKNRGRTDDYSFLRDFFFFLATAKVWQKKRSNRRAVVEVDSNQRQSWSKRVEGKEEVASLTQESYNRSRTEKKASKEGGKRGYARCRDRTEARRDQG